MVVDSTGAVIPGAKVTLTGPTGSTTVTSDNEGNFMFTRLVPGNYGVKVEKQGFKAADVKDVAVALGKTSSLRMQLEPGAATETVEVSANAVTVDTTSTASGSDLSDTFYSKVPTQRNVSSLFYVAPGVADSGGAGRANPSISGGSGLENLYVADGVNITDAAFGGLGVFTRNQGSVGTGINLSFIKEVQVKTGGFEPQYGQATGGVVQIVTKSGGNAYHGAIAGYASSRGMTLDRKQTDPVRFINAGTLDNPANYDVSGELGGYVPGFKDKLFFFGSYNPSWTFNYATPAQFPDDASTLPSDQLGLFTLSGGRAFTLRTFTNNYAGKLTYKLNDRHTVESSVFGDPSSNNQGPENLNLAAQNNGGFSKWDYGTRNWVVRYNGTLSPSWLVNANFTWANNRFTETPLLDVYSVTDNTRGNISLQGFGFKENHDANDFAYTVDTSKVVNAWGQHTFMLGFNEGLLNYDNVRRRSGPGYAPPATNLAGGAVPYSFCPGPDCPTNAGTISDASFVLRNATPFGCTICPTFNGIPVLLQQTRGQTGGNLTPTEGLYYAGYGNDTWQINKFVTVSLGLRWEQYTMRGTAANYTFTDNWAPRLGVVIDPKGDRRSKFYANFGRYNYQMPLDAAIRSLSSETDLTNMFFLPDSTGGVVVPNADGSVSFGTDAAHFLNGAPGGVARVPTVSISGAGEAFSPGTKMQYEDEWIAGFERDMGHGVIVSARYVDRRLRRVVEDMSGMSPEGANAGLAQQFSIGNPGTGTDLFHNVNETTFTGPDTCTPAGGFAVIGPITDANGNVVSPSSLCFAPDPNAITPDGAFGGDVGPDGLPDGFANPVRNYQAVEIEANKGFSNGWLMRANYRIARLRGNYEGAFRNDNGQTDPSISSLFDFTTGILNELGDQFAVGPLNTDRRHVVNGFFSYTFPNTRLKGFTMGTGIRVQGGTPISTLADHPVYQNAGEVPIGGRGVLGRTPVTGQVDLHADYPWKMTERSTMRFAIDLFNVSNSKPVLAVDQNRDLTLGAAFSNPDFLKPGNSNSNIQVLTGYQDPFRARFSLRWEF
ncbi:MAG TPA: carboxypeptidase regulatory-like domain-containing protein [Candidatus Limnocylindrales bacterium]|nr:carboxypeptidase regulatory-like domain-containing protein [Candidatus Limnocylindrales bacterium]